jgi:hypothetical protein
VPIAGQRKTSQLYSGLKDHGMLDMNALGRLRTKMKIPKRREKYQPQSI